MLAGKRFDRLRTKWLGRLNRELPFADMDEWVSASDTLRREDADSWWELQADVAGVSESYGIAPWHVTWATMVEDYSPESSEGTMFALDG